MEGEEEVIDRRDKHSLPEDSRRRNPLTVPFPLRKLIEEGSTAINLMEFQVEEKKEAPLKQQPVNNNKNILPQ